MEHERSLAWARYSNGVSLLGNIALIQVLDPVVPLNEQNQRRARSPIALREKLDQMESSDFRRIALRQLEMVCNRLSAGFPLENKGFWLAKGGGASLSTTRDRTDGRFIGLHIDRWERRSLETISAARNRVCLNMGPDTRYLVFVSTNLRYIADLYNLDAANSCTTSHAQAYLRDHPEVPVYRVRVEPGEAYIAPTE
jgi:hypothetical protein